MKKAQKNQKAYYDRKSRGSNFSVGERVFLFKPAEKTGESRKLNRPYHGPYRIVEVTPNNASLCRVDKPHEEPILVALSRLRRCPEEVEDGFWPPGGNKGKGSRSKKKGKKASAPESSQEDDYLPEDVNLTELEPDTSAEVPVSPSTAKETQKSVWKGRLRKR